MFFYERAPDDADDVIFHPDLGDEVSRKWYEEIEHWSFKNGTAKRDRGAHVHTGFFTAMIWRGVTRFGIGFCEFNGHLYIVARYYPHPNMPDEFIENVTNVKEVTEMYKGSELAVKTYDDNEVITLFELKADNPPGPNNLPAKAGQCVRPSLKHSIKHKDWYDFRKREGDYTEPPLRTVTGQAYEKGPPALSAYLNNKFGRISSSILRPVRPQYLFYRSHAKHDGKLVDELTYKRGAIIKYLGLTISGRVHYKYEGWGLSVIIRTSVTLSIMECNLQ